MTRETRIGLLVGLALIILFGVILTSITSPSEVGLPSERIAQVPPGYRPDPLQEFTTPKAIELSADGELPPLDNPKSSEDESRGGLVRSSIAPPVESGDGGVGAELSERSAAQRPREAPQPASAGFPSPRTHIVRPNESLFKIARKYYGDGRLYRLIWQANKDKLPDEDSLRVGQVLVIPEIEASPAPQQAVPDRLAPVRKSRYQELGIEELRRFFAAGRQSEVSPRAKAKVHVVRSGDNLTRIAKRYLNDDSRSAVLKIYAANRDKLQSPDRLPVGVRLTIPG